MPASALTGAWRALAGEDAALAAVAITEPRPILSSPLAVGELAVACVASALAAAGELAQARGAEPPRSVTLDALHVEASFTSERHARADGRSFGAGFSPFSTWLRTRDGWLRSHGNYARHRAALLRALSCPEDADACRAAASRRGAEELEEAIFAAGGCAAALRDPAAWEAHPQGAALAGRGLVDLDHGRPRAAPLRPLAHDELPAAGVRVIDLTRVIAGPVAGRTLAALGAQVLRIDAPGAPEFEQLVIDTGPGKRSACLDLRTRAGAGAFHALLADADVLIAGYRPGALEALGFGRAAVTARYPNLVTAGLSAWGEQGPWGRRRGFDSLVQSASGIAVECSVPDAEAPGALPAQALDHGTGHLIAAAVLRGLAERARSGRPLHSRLALARTAAWLLSLPRPDGAPGPAAAAADEFMIDLASAFGPVTLVAPPGKLDGRPLRWTTGPEPIGRSAAAWV
jgi:hypothetical protein